MVDNPLRMPGKKVLLSLITNACIYALIPSIAYAGDKVIPQAEIDRFVQQAEQEVRHQALPMGRLIVSEKNGKTTLMSDNGRYRFQGPIIDNWAELEINTYEDARFSAEHLPMHNIGLNSDMLAPLRFGQNEQQRVLVFLSPDDPASRHFLSELPDLGKDFRFELVIVPSSQTPGQMATAFSCVQDEGRALDILLSGQDLDEVRPAPGCDLQMLNNRMIAFRLLGFYDLPTVIAPSSRLSIGDRPEGWSTFLMENMQ